MRDQERKRSRSSQIWVIVESTGGKHIHEGPSTGKSGLTRGVKNLVNDPAIHERPGAKALKIFPDIWVIVESTGRKHIHEELEERRHSWSDSSVLDN